MKIIFLFGSRFRGNDRNRLIMMQNELTDYSETVPVQYEKKNARFMGMDVYVDERVLIPRPETELLVKVAVDHCIREGIREPRILEIGTGSGCVSIALKIAIPESDITATDISWDALDVAGENIERLLAGDNITLIRANMFERIGTRGMGKFDIILSNPPYVSEKDYEKLDPWVKAEPKAALLGGKDGMDYLNVIVRESPEYLLRGGMVAVEIGYDQAGKVKELFGAAGFGGIESFKDSNGHERVVKGVTNG
ncbi:MAG: peptide chain release factor N(5)-glutamine methyltransferase [Candidatus Omnitrophica bacterium]|nr:peptide chain release factor N(5)-glutamine methyltransferase [Candidatus Omnitrophota bacterium]